MERTADEVKTYLHKYKTMTHEELKKAFDLFIIEYHWTLKDLEMFKKETYNLSYIIRCCAQLVGCYNIGSDRVHLHDGTMSTNTLYKKVEELIKKVGEQ